jgi:branched-chain amino acid transport system permease protein
MSSKKQTINSFSVIIFIIFLFMVPLFLKNNYWLHVLGIVGINVILVSSLHTIRCTGEISMGTGGFMAIGAYASALLAMKVGLSFWLTMLLGGVLCAAVAVILGYPLMRTKGIYFSILTLVTAEVFRLIAWYYRSLTGGSVGLSGIPSPNPITIPGISTIMFETKMDYYYLILVITLLSLLVLYRLQSSQIGFVWGTIREMDHLAASVGINVLWYKIFAFTIGSFFMGIAGALFAHFMHLLAADATGKFGMTTSIYILIYMVFGGEGKFIGPVIGAFVLTMLPETFRAMKEYQPIIFGALVILIVFFIPQGIIALPDRILSWRRRKKASDIMPV